MNMGWKACLTHCPDNASEHRLALRSKVTNCDSVARRHRHAPDNTLECAGVLLCCKAAMRQSPVYWPHNTILLLCYMGKSAVPRHGNTTEHVFVACCCSAAKKHGQAIRMDEDASKQPSAFELRGQDSDITSGSCRIIFAGHTCFSIICAGLSKRRAQLSNVQLRCSLAVILTAWSCVPWLSSRVPMQAANAVLACLH